VAIASALGHWIFILILKGHNLEFCKNVLLPLEPELFLNRERIGEELQIVCEVLYTANS
jgi:hypothetical protein